MAPCGFKKGFRHKCLQELGGLMQGEKPSAGEGTQANGHFGSELSFEVGQELVGDCRVCAQSEDNNGYPALGE